MRLDSGPCGERRTAVAKGASSLAQASAIRRSKRLATCNCKLPLDYSIGLDSSWVQGRLSLLGARSLELRREMSSFVLALTIILQMLQVLVLLLHVHLVLCSQSGGPQQGGWVGAEKFMLKRFMCLFCP